MLRSTRIRRYKSTNELHTDNSSRALSSGDAVAMSVFSTLGNPPTVAGKAMAPRAPSLSGKTVYLVDVRFDNSGDFMEQLQYWFSTHAPDIRTKLVQWKEPFLHDVDLAEEIRQRGDAAVLGVGL
jgi:hypothetical protein